MSKRHVNPVVQARNDLGAAVRAKAPAEVVRYARSELLYQKIARLLSETEIDPRHAERLTALMRNQSAETPAENATHVAAGQRWREPSGGLFTVVRVEGTTATAQYEGEEDEYQMALSRFKLCELVVAA